MKAKDIIKNKRRELGITQKELGDMTGYSQQTIQKLENGERTLDENKKILMAKALQIDPKDLFIEQIAAASNSIGCSPADLMPNKNTSSTLIDYNSEDAKTYLRQVMIDVDIIAKKCNGKLSENDRADLTIALFEETYGLSDDDKRSRLEYLVKFFIKMKNLSKKAL